MRRHADSVAPDAPFEPIAPGPLRAALGRFATGVTIVTCADADGARIGLTVNSFNALSLDPALILWSLRLASPSLPAFRRASHFAVNVLAENQVGLSRRFASPTPDKFADGHWSAGLGGAPVLGGCVAVLECECADAREFGDHALFIGHVRRMSDAPLPPLIFQSGRYHLLGKLI